MSKEFQEWLAQTPGANQHPDLGRRLQLAGLDELYADLGKGKCIRSSLEVLYAEAAPTLHPEDYTPGQLESRILELADRTDLWTLRTRRYRLLETGDPKVIPQLERELHDLWDRYAATPVPENQVTLESVVIHKLLKRAFDSWFLALATARQGKWEEALQVAEQANALLHAVIETQEEIEDMTGAVGLDFKED